MTIVKSAGNLINAYLERQIELHTRLIHSVHLIRHGEKNKSTAAVDPNQLTENGRRDALAYGARLQTAPTLDVFCSTDAEGRAIDRSHDTGWYVHAGYAGLDYDAANALFRSDSAERKQFVPGLEKRLQQYVPQRILDEYKANKITRAEAMEQCYKMLAADAGNVDPAERALMLEGAKSYYAVLIRLNTQAHDYKQAHTTVLVGHDPNIGCLQQALEPNATLQELAPLHGIIFRELELDYWLVTLLHKMLYEIPLTLKPVKEIYSFASAGKEYKGVTISMDTMHLLQ